MKESESLKLLIPWIEKACDEHRYPGLMEWVDKPSKLFSVSWVHKSSELWDKSKSKVFEDWATDKRKLGEKDDRDLKAAFRNALRSKKSDLKFVEKCKNYRNWQIISKKKSSSSALLENNKVTKEKRKRGPKRNSQIKPATIIEMDNEETSTSLSSAGSSTPLPPYETIFPSSPSFEIARVPYSPQVEDLQQNVHQLDIHEQSANQFYVPEEYLSQCSALEQNSQQFDAHEESTDPGLYLIQQDDQWTSLLSELQDKNLLDNSSVEEKTFSDLQNVPSPSLFQSSFMNQSLFSSQPTTTKLNESTSPTNAEGLFSVQPPYTKTLYFSNSKYFTVESPLQSFRQSNAERIVPMVGNSDELDRYSISDEVSYYQQQEFETLSSTLSFGLDY